ncbi:MAG: hypothetical protein J2P41_22645 [Blastocatellia bacterium]|nr:hypothetical protein [Blastocatellia bacterium]
MNCEEFERTIVEHYDSGGESEASAHAQVCARCAALLKRELGMTIGLAALAADEAAINAPERVRSALRAAFDKQHAAGHPFRTRSLPSKLLWGMAAAATLLLFSITTTLFLRGQLPKTAVQPAASDPAAPLISAIHEGANEARRSGETGAVAGSAGQRNHRPKLSVKDRSASMQLQSPNAAAQTPASDQAAAPLTTAITEGVNEARLSGETLAVARSTDRGTRRPTPPVKDGNAAIPLTFVAKSEPTEFIQTLRVELSRSALLTLGVPVNIERGEGLIKAEIIIGEDGVARAVRIIN